jgi:hypothetical protein
VQREGVLRDDVDLETVIAFVNIVANGLALAVSLGLKLDVDALLKLVHRGIDPVRPVKQVKRIRPVRPSP